VDRVADDSFGCLAQILLERPIEILEFGPKGLLDKGSGYSEHQSCVALAVAPIRFQAVSSAQRKKQHPRPGIMQAELILNLDFFFPDLVKAGHDPQDRVTGSDLFAIRSWSRIKRLQLLEFCFQLLFIHYSVPPSISRLFSQFGQFISRRAYPSGSLMVQELLIAKRDLRLSRIIQRMAKFDEVILVDDIGYVQQTRE
jgi:hypothetical protein